MKKITCATCPHRIDEDPFFHWCGLEETENSHTDVAYGFEPFDFQPEWCLLRNEDDPNGKN